MLKKVCCAIAILATPLIASAQLPDPVRLVIPYSAGGNVDTIARLIAPGLSRALKTSVVVENKPGAGGMIAGEHVARAKPDGSTLFFTSNGPILHSPTIYGKPVYDWKKDFIPVGSVSMTPLVLLASPSSRFASLANALHAAKEKPRSVSMATPGSGSTNHLTGILLEQQTGTAFNMIHYKGTAPATADLLGGHVQLSFDQIAPALPQLNKGALDALAVTSAERLPTLPKVPTFSELGLPALQVSSFVGMFAPAGTPTDTVAALNRALSVALDDKELSTRFEQLGAIISKQSPGEFKIFLEKEDALWLPLIKNSSIKAN